MTNKEASVIINRFLALHDADDLFSLTQAASHDVVKIELRAVGKQIHDALVAAKHVTKEPDVFPIATVPRNRQVLSWSTRNRAWQLIYWSENLMPDPDFTHWCALPPEPTP